MFLETANTPGKDILLQGVEAHEIAVKTSCLSTEYFVCVSPSVLEHIAANSTLSFNTSVHAHSLHAIYRGPRHGVLRWYKQSLGLNQLSDLLNALLALYVNFSR